MMTPDIIPHKENGTMRAMLEDDTLAIRNLGVALYPAVRLSRSDVRVFQIATLRESGRR